jgi:hypothetical protein
MWWADIEVPNDPVDMDSQGPSACYPRRNFYPLSNGLSSKHHWIIIANLRSCIIRQFYSQANLNYYVIFSPSGQEKFTFAHLRYLLGGDRPSQTNNHKLSFFYKKLIN